MIYLVAFPFVVWFSGHLIGKSIAHVMIFIGD